MNLHGIGDVRLEYNVTVCFNSEDVFPLYAVLQPSLNTIICRLFLVPSLLSDGVIVLFLVGLV